MRNAGVVTAVLLAGILAFPAEEPGRPGEVVRCTRPSGEVLPARTILEDLRKGKDVDLEGRLIEGSLNADAAWPAATDDVSSLRVVSGRLRLASCRIEGAVTFRESVLVRGLDLSCTEVRGDLDLSGSRALGDVQVSKARLLGAVRLAGMSVDGDLVFDDTTIDQGFVMADARVNGRFGLDRGEIRRDVEISQSFLGRAELDDVRLARGATVRDVLVLSDLSARDAMFSRDLMLDTVRVGGRVDLDAASGPDGIALRNLTVGEHLRLALNTGGPLELLDVTVDGGLSLWDGRFEDVTLERVVVGRDTEFEEARFRGKLRISDSDFGESFTADDTRFLDECVFQRVRFPGDDPMEGARFARMPTIIDSQLAHTFNLGQTDEDVDEIDEFDREFEEFDNEDAPP